MPSSCRNPSAMVTRTWSAQALPARDSLARRCQLVGAIVASTARPVGPEPDGGQDDTGNALPDAWTGQADHGRGDLPLYAHQPEPVHRSGKISGYPRAPPH